ncbi:ATP-binding protein [Granulicella cerasi]|uniref:histidine kinase n=1 Tax=Granulicella cerasi TaxID=741063 RepID=A0ABW1Z646_9BACT|nr:ATP-binding protein [Granulicella cerasi]
MNSRRFIAVTRWVVAFGALAGIVIAYRQWVHVNPTTVALTLVLFVLVLAAQWELRYAVAVSVAATAAYNFYFLPPVGTFTIVDPQNWLALFTFLATSIIGSRLSQWGRAEAEKALTRQRELEVLYLLSRELLQVETVASAVQAAPSLINTSAFAESVVLYLLNGDKLYQAGIHPVTGAEVPRLRQMALTLSVAQSSLGNEVIVPLRTGVRPRGLLAIRGASLTMDGLEAVGGLVSITLDRAQAIEEAAKAEANKESERLRTLILDSITHELRTPLTSIKGAAQSLLSDPEPQASARKELASIVEEEANRLDRLVGQAVEMAQLEAREVQMQIEPLSMQMLVEEALESCSWVAATHPLEIHVPDEPRVAGDRELLGKVICNLLENAAKYSSAGSPIFVSTEVREGMLATSIADRGVGIDPSEQALIFDRLYRSKVQASGTSGTGMGLSICRAIIDSHHGSIAVTSQLGQGSVFTFTLPLTGN